MRSGNENEECEDARILFNEGLIDEAKKRLFRVLIRVPRYPPAIALLKKIEAAELKKILAPGPDLTRSVSVNQGLLEDESETVIQELELALDLGSDLDRERGKQEFFLPNHALNYTQKLDLAVAYLEMGCFSDALRELKQAEREIRNLKSFLDSTGIAIVALTVRCLLSLDRAFEAKVYLAPVLQEPDLRHDDKLLLYYEAGCIEEDLNQLESAHDWFQRVLEMDPFFKDVAHRIRYLGVSSRNV